MKTYIRIDAPLHIDMVGAYKDLACKGCGGTQDIEWSDADSQMYCNIDCDVVSVVCDSCKEGEQGMQQW